jgi:hypothetical protein
MPCKNRNFYYLFGFYCNKYLTLHPISNRKTLSYKLKTVLLGSSQ